MSQLDLEQLELEGEEHLAENQPAPGKATLTSRIGKPHRAGAGDLIDGATAAQLAGGLGVELSRGDGGGGGDGGAPGVKKGKGLGFLGGRGAEMGGDVAGEELEVKTAGRGLEYLGGASLAAQQREVVDFDRGAGDSFYDARATVDARLTGGVELGKRRDEEKEGDEDEDDETPSVRASARLEAQLPRPTTPGASRPGGDLRAQQRAVVDFDTAAGDSFYDARATVDAKLTVDARPGKKRDLETERAEDEGEETPSVRASARLEAPVEKPATAPGASLPDGNLRAQQREVVDFDRAVGDTFYDQRATVDPAIAKAPAAPPAPELARTPAAPPLPELAKTPGADLKSQQREVVDFDRAVGDTFYDQRATVEPAIAKPPAAPSAPELAKTPAAPPLPELAKTPGADLKSQQREVVDFDRAVGDTFYDQRATVEPPATTGAAAGAAGVAAAEQAANAAVSAIDPAADEAKIKAQTDAEKAHEAMHAAAGTAGGAIETAQANAVAAQQKTDADAKKPDVVGMIDPDLKGKKPPARPGDDVPLDAIDPALAGKKTPARPGDVPLDATNPDLKAQRPGQPGKPGEVPLDATNPDLKAQRPGQPGKPGEVSLDAIDPELKREKLAGGLLDPYEDEPIFDLTEFENLPGGELKQPDAAGADAMVAPSLEGKVELARANPQATKDILKGVQQDATIKKGVIKQGVDAKSAAVGKAQQKGVAGAAAKGGKKVSTVAGKGNAAADKAKGKAAEKKVEKAKNIEELKQRLETAFQDEKKKLTEKLAEQKKDLEKKIGDEQKKIDDEMKAQADKLAKELAAKNKDIDKQIAEKKKAYDKQIAEDKKKAEKTCKDEQKKTQQTTDKEVAKIQKQGDSEAQKVTQQGHKDAAAARQRGNAKANAALNGANQKAAGIEDAAAKQSAKDAGQRAANAARSAANAEAKQIEAAAKAEAEKRKALTKKLVEETREKGKKAQADLDAKLQQSLTDINKKATDGTAKMEAERQKMVGELKQLEDKLKAESAKKNEDAKFKIHQLKLDSEKRIKDMETNGLKGITTKHDEMLVKLEKGKAEDLAKLEEETNKIVGDIKMSVASTTAAVDKEIKLAQDKAAFEAKKRVDAIQADGKKQLDELDKKAKDVQAKIEAIDAETRAGLKKAGEDAKKGLEEQGQSERDAIVAGADRAVADLAKTSDQYEADKKAEEEAARKAKEEEERKKAEEEKAKADAEKKKEEEKKAEEEKKKKEFEAKTAGAADELFKAMDGWGTDEKAVMNALKGKTPEEMKAIKDAYQKKTGRSLDADLADEMSGTDLKEAKALMSADPVQGAVAQLQSAMEGWGTDEQKVKDTLAGITDPEMKKKVIAEYEKATGQRLQAALEEEGIGAGENIDTADYAKEEEQPTGPQRELSEEEKKAANTAVTELEGAMNRWGTDEAAVFNALKGKSPEQIAMMKKAWAERHPGQSLDAILEDELSGTDLKEAKALMSADPVQAAVAQLHNASDGLGTDDEKILATLKDIKDPEVRKKVAEEYEKQTGDKLDAMLEDEMSGMDKDLAKALKGDETGKVNQGEVAAIEADKAMHGGFLTDISDGIADTIGADREAMRTVTGGVVTAVVLGPLAGPVLAFGGGAVIGTDIGGTDEEALYKALESCETPEQREELKKAYEKRYPGRTLEGDLKGELTAKEQDVTNALLVGDKTSAEAAKMAAAADGLGTDRKALYASLEGKSKEEREAIIAKFNEKYAKDWPKETDPKTGKELSPFEAMCKDELDELDQKKAAMIAEDGKMNDGFAAYYAMNEGFLGIGTDDDLLKSRLQGKSKEEVLQIQKEYLRAKCEAEGKPVPPDLDKMTADNPALQALNQDIAGETSGRTGHQLKQALKGNPTTPEEALQRAKEDLAFEREESGWIGEVGMAVLLGPGGYAAAKAMGVDPSDISNGLTDMWSDSGKQLEWDVAKLEADIAESKKKHANDPSLVGLSDEERKKKLDELVMKDLKGSGQLDFVAGSQKQYEEAKDATADAAGTAVAIAVGAVITIASGGTAAPALVALISGLAGVSAKMIISGASMSNEQLVQELAQVAAEALAAGLVNTKALNGAIEKLAGKFGNGLAAKIVKEALEEAVESGTEELILALLDENLYKGDLVDFAKGVGGRVGKAALTGAGAAVVSTGFGDLMPGMNKLASSGIHGKAAAGAINQAVGAAFTTAIDPNTYNGSGADVAMAFGKSMGSAALRGLQDGYSTGEGFKSGDGWKSGPTQKVDTRSSGPDAATASTHTTGTTSSSEGDTSIDAKTEVDVKKSATEVQVVATGTTTVTGPNGTNTASDSATQTIPLDAQGKPADAKPTAQNDGKPTAQSDGKQTAQNDNKTQPIDADTLVDTDAKDNQSTPLDGKQGADPSSQTAVDTSARMQADIDAAKQAHAGGDPKALQAALQNLPGASNLEVVADATPGPLAPNQVTAATAAKAIIMLDAAMKSKVGQDAVKALQDLGVTLTFNAGEGSFCQGNRINIDPSMASDANELAGLLAHEVHHAKTFDKDVDITKTRDQYVADTLKNEAQAQAALFEHFQQTGQVDDSNAQRQFGAKEYFGAYDAAAKAFVAANPDATADQVHEHAKQAGIAALQAVFGSATPSTSVDEDGNLKPGEPATYADLYGQWHDAHSPVGLVAQNQGAPIPTAQQAAPKGVSPVEGPDPKLVALTEKAYQKYAATLGDAKALLQSILGKFGEIMGRAKDPVSAANRLQRAIDNFGAQVTDVDSAIANIWDAIGTRVVIGNATPEVMAQTVAKLAEAIKSGQLKITAINNLHGADAKPYLTADQVAALAAEAHAATGQEVTTNASKVMAGGFTSVCIYVEYASGVKGEIQIIGEQAMQIANVEHIPYDIGIGKPLVRGIDPSLQAELHAITGPIETAMKAVNGDPTLKAAYEKYLSEMYAYARDLEMGLEATPPSLPAGIDQSLSVEGLQKVMAAIEALKQKQKALEAKKEGEGESKLKSPAPLVQVIPNAEADAMPPPQSKQELLDFALKKYGNVLDKYVGAPHTSNPKFEALLAELAALQPGEWANNPEKADDALARWMAISAEIEAESGKSEADLRELYGILEKTDMPRWLTMMEGKTDKEKAEALYEMRKQWRIIVRDLMTDENSKEILYLRDRALSGHRTGPALQDLLDRNLKKTNGDLDAAYRRIVESAMKSNAKVDKGILGKTAGTNTEQQSNQQTDEQTDQKKDTEKKNPKVPSPQIVDPKQQAEENRRRVEESKAQRDKDFQETGVDGEKGKHGGTEVHSHWLGVIKTDVFAEKFGGWKALLEAITKLDNANLRHTHHEGGKQTIKERGVAGDAMRIAEETLRAVNADPPTHPRLVKALNDFAGDKAAQAAELERVKNQMIEDAVRQCLEASPDTDFNSAYEIRDELIKEKFGGEKQPGETKEEAEARELRAYAELCRLTVKRLIEDGILLTEQSNSIAKLTKRFSAEMLQAAIDANLREIAKTDPERAQKLAEDFRVRFLSMGLSINYGKQDRRWEGFRERFFSPDQKAELERRLDGVDSKSQRAKITRDFENEVEQTRWLGEMVKQFGYETALKVLESELATLQEQQPGLMEQARGGDPNALNENRRRIKEVEGYIDEMQRSPDLQKIKKGVLERQDIVGIDTAGQELYEFSAKGKQRFKMMYMALVEAAKAKGQVLVFRPHVGEGAINPMKGAVWNAFNQRWEGKDGKPIHYERAENNVEAMIEVLRELEAEGLLDPKRVTVRFGHATHTNPEQAKALAELGVIAEVNLGSNIATNVADQATDAPDGQRTQKAEEDFSDHSFLTLIFNQVQTILSTDGHAVEKTSMGEEYARAHKIIEDFLAGKMKVRVTLDQAEAGFPGRGTKKDGFVELSVDDLTSEELDRFLAAYKQLHAWANQYRDTAQRGGTPIDADGNPIGSAQNPAAPRSPAPRSPAPRSPAPRSPAPVNRNQSPNNAVAPQQTNQPTQDDLNKQELARIRQGVPGTIRDESQLSNADVVKSLDAQLAKVSPEGVEAIASQFPGEESEAKLVMARSSGFGTMESLNDLRVAMDQALRSGAPLFTPGRGSLADNIAYAADKEAFASVPGANHNSAFMPATTSTLVDGAVVILDPVVLDLIKNKPGFAQELVTKNCVLIEPKGFSAGINMFNSKDPAKLAEHTRRILERAKAIVTDGGAPDLEAAISVALSEGTLQILQAAGVTNNVKVVHPAENADVNAATISRQVSGTQGMTEAELKQELDQLLDDNDRNMARELLAQQGEVFSPRRFAADLAAKHAEIMAQAAAKGIPPEKVFFLIPKDFKSYGMIAMAHREATGTPPGQYLNGPSEVDGLGPDCLVVIFDDVAGSGDSLHQASAAIGKGTHPRVRNPKQFQGEVIVAPMVSTEMARTLFTDPTKSDLSRAPGLSFDPQQMSKALRESDFFKKLPVDVQNRLIAMIRPLGFGQNGVSMAFPYMSPDNNNQLFFERFARYFIMNRNQEAAKPPG